jgi:hypothetical protein
MTIPSTAPQSAEGTRSFCVGVSRVTLCARYKNGASTSALTLGTPLSPSYSVETETMDYMPIVRLLTAALNKKEKKENV